MGGQGQQTWTSWALFQLLVTFLPFFLFWFSVAFLLYLECLMTKPQMGYHNTQVECLTDFRFVGPILYGDGLWWGLWLNFEYQTSQRVKGRPTTHLATITDINVFFVRPLAEAAYARGQVPPWKTKFKGKKDLTMEPKLHLEDIFPPSPRPTFTFLTPPMCPTTQNIH